MNTKPLAVAGVAISMMVIGGCSNPEPIETSPLIGLSLVEAVEAVDALDAELKVSTSPDVDITAAGAQQWFVRTVSPSSDIFPGDDISLSLQSAFGMAKGECYGGELADEASTLIIDMKGKNAGSGTSDYASVECLLQELDVPTSVFTSMTATRALDGRQTAEWDGITAEWTYHPDDGLDIILTLDD